MTNPVEHTGKDKDPDKDEDKEIDIETRILRIIHKDPITLVTQTTGHQQFTA